MNSIDVGSARNAEGVSIVRNVGISEIAGAAEGFYTAQCFDAAGNLKWEDRIENVVCDEGVQAMLTNALKGSAYTAANYMGLIGATSYVSVPVAANTMASHATWVEATSGICAARVAPTLGSASGRSLATSSAASFSIVGTETIKGCFLAIKSAAGVAPTSAVANTSGALWSAGLFTGGDKAVANGDTLNVTYTTSL